MAQAIGRRRGTRPPGLRRLRHDLDAPVGAPLDVERRQSFRCVAAVEESFRLRMRNALSNFARRCSRSTAQEIVDRNAHRFFAPLGLDGYQKASCSKSEQHLGKSVAAVAAAGKDPIDAIGFRAGGRFGNSLSKIRRRRATRTRSGKFSIAPTFCSASPTPAPMSPAAIRASVTRRCCSATGSASVAS